MDDGGRHDPTRALHRPGPDGGGVRLLADRRTRLDLLVRTGVGRVSVHARRVADVDRGHPVPRPVRGHRGHGCHDRATARGARTDESLDGWTCGPTTASSRIPSARARSTRRGTATAARTPCWPRSPLPTEVLRGAAAAWGRQGRRGSRRVGNRRHAGGDGGRAWPWGRALRPEGSRRACRRRRPGQP